MAEEHKFIPVKPGTVHFEFGRHSVERDAVFRLRDHFKGNNVPDHVLMESAYYVKERALPERDAIKVAREIRGMAELLASELSQGRKVSNERQMEPYGLKRTRIILGANKPKPRVKVHIEPFSEEVVREYNAYLTSKEGLGKAMQGGELDPALESHRETIRHYVAAAHIRERNIIGYLKELRKNDPEGRILCDLGYTHGHVELALQREGIPTSSRTIWAPGEFGGPLIPTLLGVELGVGPKPSKERLEELHRRNLLFTMLRAAGNTPERADKVAMDLSPDELGALYGQLERPGKDLIGRTVRWLDEHKKL